MIVDCAVARRTVLLIQCCALLLATSCTPSIQLPKRYAVIYGISRYVDSLDPGSPPNLTYTDDDAISVGQMLEERGYEVLVRIDSDATLKQLRSDLDDLQGRLSEGDLFLFYYSGHGAQSDGELPGKELPAAGNDPEEEWIYLSGSVSYDTTSKALSIDYSKTLNDDQLGELIGSIPCSRKLVIIDACNSGGFIGNHLEVDLIPPVFTGEPEVLSPQTFLQAMALYSMYAETSLLSSDISPVEAVVISAAGERELAFEDRSVGHGVFTYFLLMSPAYGDLNRDGYVTALEAYAFTRSNIDSLWNERFLDSGFPEYYTFAPHISGGPVDYVLFAAD